MSRARLTNRAARRIFLDRHALLEQPVGQAKGQALLDLIKRLGFVQLDSINTVARAHDLILFARRPRYRPDDLTRLYRKGDTLFEHWTHDAAVIPIEFYRWWHLRRQRDAARLLDRWRSGRRDGFEAQFEAVRELIREKGPLTSAEVGEGEARGSGGWWDWHPSKTALEYLWRKGDLCVVGRDAFKKRYDLTERFLDQSIHDHHAPSHAETVSWCCNQALDRLGFATHGEIAAFWDHITPAEARAWCDRACSRGEITLIDVEGADGKCRAAFARPDIDQDPAAEIDAPGRVRILSPFDPALRDRKRAERLFGFEYRIEVFVPEPKRRYGYYVFPILESERLIGRVDMKAHRDQDVLRVRALWPETKVRWSKGRHAAFEAELERIKKVAGVSNVSFEPEWLRLE
ncbi:MAG: crosslink repair DNA glycosylase YcaQ family protein [Pseudomonadota bacterium]